jgi:hypothetical protein
MAFEMIIEEWGSRQRQEFGMLKVRGLGRRAAVTSPPPQPAFFRVKRRVCPFAL